MLSIDRSYTVIVAGEPSLCMYTRGHCSPHSLLCHTPCSLPSRRLSPFFFLFSPPLCLIPSASANYWRGLIKFPIDPFEFELRTIECPSKGLLYDLSSQRIFQLEAVDVMLLVAISCYQCE